MLSSSGPSSTNAQNTLPLEEIGAVKKLTSSFNEFKMALAVPVRENRAVRLRYVTETN